MGRKSSRYMGLITDYGGQPGDSTLDAAIEMGNFAIRLAFLIARDAEGMNVSLEERDGSISVAVNSSYEDDINALLQPLSRKEKFTYTVVKVDGDDEVVEIDGEDLRDDDDDSDDDDEDIDEEV